MLLLRLSARPLLVLCLVVVSGAAAGAAGGVAGASWRGFLVVAIAGWMVAAVGRARTALMRACLCVACALVAGLRATEARSERLAAEVASVPRGTFSSRSGGETVLARLAPATRPFTLPRGLVAEGEEVVLDPIHSPAAWPAGPVPGPRRAAGASPTVELGPGEIVRVGTAPPTLAQGFEDTFAGLRRVLTRRTDDLRDPDTRAFVRALLFGDTSELATDLPDLFVRTGTFHVLAVSGMQVVLVLGVIVLPVCALLAWALARLFGPRSRRWRAWIALFVLVAFVPIAGAGAPIVRSALGAGLALVAPHLPASRGVVVSAHGRSTRVRLARRADPLSGLACALILECILHPEAPTSLSVQLSYAATFGLIVGTRPMLGIVRACTGLDRPRGELFARTSRTGRARSPWLLVPIERGVQGLCCAVAASLAAVLATLPFVWARLSEWSPWGVLATPALGFSSAVLFVGGWLHVAAPWLAPEFALDHASRAMVGSMRAFDLLPCTPSVLPPRPDWLVAAACALTFAAARAGRRSGAARLAALAWAILIVPWQPVGKRITIHALDVGAGTAVVIDGPGLGTWVFDAGSRDRPDVAREALGPLLAALEPGAVHVVLSHADRDHDGALGWLVERFPPALFAGALSDHVATRLSPRTAHIRLDQGTTRLFERSDVTLDLVRARRGAPSDNEASYALELSVRGERVILFGDTEAEGLDAWLAARREILPAALVLWPHHGSDTDRLDALVRATRPGRVWISGSGTPPAARELARRALPLECTSSSGALRFQLPTAAADARMEPP